MEENSKAGEEKVKQRQSHREWHQIECQDCDHTYFGETERNLHKRLKEYKRESSPVHEHLAQSHHQFRGENVNVLEKDSRWLQRGVKEAIHITANNPTLNRYQRQPTTYLRSTAPWSSRTAVSFLMAVHFDPISASGHHSVDKGAQRSTKSE